MKLLIVDDEAHIRQMMRFTLEAAGYEVEEAATGEEGLQQFGAGHSHDAVLLDQKMPGIDGLQTLKAMKGRLPEACVIMVTAFASIDLAVDAMRLGATDFLRKPMTPDTLRGAVAAALASHPRTPLKQPVLVDNRASASGVVAGELVATAAPDGYTLLLAHRAFERFRLERAASRIADEPVGETVARVARLSRHALSPGGAFWREQAERLLSAFLWSEGKAPADGRLTVHDISREDLDVAAAWTAD
jgi:DNA-binding response OmpR family regulator